MLDLKRHRSPAWQQGDRLDRQRESSRANSITPDEAAPQGLASVHLAWGLPSEDLLRWLLEQGVPDSALWPIGGARVRFDGRAFDLEHGGEQAITFRALDRGEVIDLVAWSPDTGALASWLGVAFCLGDLDDITNPATYFDRGALHVHADPLQWLKADREGIVIVRPEMAHVHLAHCTRIVASDLEHALRLESWLAPRRATATILTPDPDHKDAGHGR